VNIFVFEWVTGGGLWGEPLPIAVVREGDMMLRALVADLQEVPDVRLTTGRDPRLPPLPGIRTLAPASGGDPLALFRRGARAADAAWPIAPETHGVLEQLARETLALHKVLLGCRPDAVRIAASKRATALALRAAGVPVVPTFGACDRLEPLPGRWVVKPDDGVGCDGAILVDDWRAAAAHLARHPTSVVAQPWIDGPAVSLSLVCRDGDVRLLCANRQHIRIADAPSTPPHPILAGIEVNAVADRDGTLARLGRRSAAAIPGLWGYVGVDLVLADTGPIVLEINPRLTTSYCGLRDALGLNPAALLLDGFRDMQHHPGGLERRTTTMVSLEADSGT
jgi:tyramine---L-glutamate ligase